MIISEGEKNRIRKMHRDNSIIKEQRGVGPTPTETLQMGDKRKEKIKEFQKFLDLPLNGIFDEKMRDEVIEFQKENGLTADGEIGEEEWKIKETKREELMKNMWGN